MEFDVVEGQIHHSQTTRDQTGQAKPRCCSPCCEACGPNLRRNRRKNQRKVREIDDNGDEPLEETKKHRGKRRKWPPEPSTKVKVNSAKNHMIDVASHRACACQRPLT